MAALVQRSLTNYHLTAAPPRGLLAALAARLRHWNRISHERRVLAGLSDYELKDFGANRGDVERELAKPFWRYPPI